MTPIRGHLIRGPAQTLATIKRFTVTREQAENVVRDYRTQHSVSHYKIRYPDGGEFSGGYYTVVMYIIYRHKYRLEKECYDEIMPAPSPDEWDYLRDRVHRHRHPAK